MNVTYNDRNYEYDFNINGVVGSCGICSVNCLELNGDVKSLKPMQRRELAKIIGKDILQRCYHANYGIAIFTTLDQSAGLADPFSAYYGSPRNGHKKELNLGTIARALGGRRGVTAENPNTGNHITSYTVITNNDLEV